MSDPNFLCAELKKLIIDTLALEDLSAEQIETHAPLFGDEGLALDSIDALEIAMVLEERYGVTLDDDPELNVIVFQSIGSIAEFVIENREN